MYNGSAPGIRKPPELGGRKVVKTWWIYSSTVLFLLLAPVTVFGTESVPKEPVVIADFENPADMALWSGVEHRQSDQFTSSGRSGMAFDIPKWDEEGNAEPRPGVCLSFADGKGFLSKDLSNWGAIVIDAWVVGDKPGKMGLKFVDEDGTNSWTTHITVEPGKKNEAKLLISDAKADCDMHHVRSIVLYALRPDSAYTLVVDNLRLLPKE